MIAITRRPGKLPLLEKIGAPIGVLLRYAGFYGPGTWLAADGMLGKR